MDCSTTGGTMPVDPAVLKAAEEVVDTEERPMMYADGHYITNIRRNAALPLARAVLGGEKERAEALQILGSVYDDATDLKDAARQAVQYQDELSADLARVRADLERARGALDRHGAECFAMSNGLCSDDCLLREVCPALQPEKPEQGGE